MTHFHQINVDSLCINMKRDRGNNITNWINARSTTISESPTAIQKFQYQKLLIHHFGCVNAVAFSPDGTLFASGGDDLRTLVYTDISNLNRSISEPIPFKKHVSNIFSIQFTKSNNLYTTGNDGFLVYHDLETGQSNVRLAHEEACQKLSVCPENENIVLTAGHDYCIKQWDARFPSGNVLLETIGRRQSCVQHNPKIHNLFLTSDDHGGLYLYDTRQLNSHIQKYTTSLLKYETGLQNTYFWKSRIRTSRPAEITSAVWSPSGQQLCANIQRWYPTLYSISDCDPIAQFHDEQFQALCTTKTGSFNSDGTVYFAGGDDGLVYGWQVPDENILLGNRNITMEIPTHGVDYLNTEYNVRVEKVEPRYALEKKDIQFKDKNRTRQVGPVRNLAELDHDERILYRGNDHIVNNISCHPSLPIVASSGIEKVVRLNTSFPIEHKYLLEGGTDPLTKEDIRTHLFFKALLKSERQTLNEHLWKRNESFEDDDDSSQSFDDLSLDEVMLDILQARLRRNPD